MVIYLSNFYEKRTLPKNGKRRINLNEKKIVGEKATDLVKNGMVVGLGTGSTVYYTIT